MRATAGVSLLAIFIGEVAIAGSAFANLEKKFENLAWKDLVGAGKMRTFAPLFVISGNKGQKKDLTVL